MRAIAITRPGPPDVLQLADVPQPTPGAGEVLVRVRAFGINRADLLQRRGMYPAPPGSPESIPGLEYAGQIQGLGDGVDVVDVGDRVMGIVGGGSYAEYLVTPAVHTVSIPEGYSFENAAAIPEAFITAHDALERLEVRAGEWVIVHAIGSGVGTAALQLIHARGAKCIGTSRTRAKLERAAGLGLDAAVDTSRDNLVDEIHRITVGGADAAVDLVGGPLFVSTLDALATRGRLVLVGLTGGRNVDLDLSLVLRKRLKIEGTVLRARSVEEKTAVTKSFVQHVLPLFSDGTLEVVLDRVFPFDALPDAHAYVESNANFGKVVASVP